MISAGPKRRRDKRAPAVDGHDQALPAEDLHRVPHGHVGDPGEMRNITMVDRWDNIEMLLAIDRVWSWLR
jgi:hypothetical protein